MLFKKYYTFLSRYNPVRINSITHLRNINRRKRERNYLLEFTRRKYEVQNIIKTLNAAKKKNIFEYRSKFCN